MGFGLVFRCSFFSSFLLFFKKLVRNTLEIINYKYFYYFGNHSCWVLSDCVRNQLFIYLVSQLVSQLIIIKNEDFIIMFKLDSFY
ncbi:hypothetical protein TTHERM_00161759 (macronuclear) [Tetrahymena thermophila SB210]|uniref:Uncharacterized protein n=1 Tax=Tetrahymena thermophila (strain SB210) TaxID=312017 RepID=A4VEH6_TETTS|nr:hypothetical protein TTHERM_00161759 [Tetrahymena thermophila SB210]EDK31961.1 hypothetical protein TTHERM_00161759 [Tetrahymena thermophila SB210]|eukprot:XP_001471198.1 hypothetical protein TTHERM_00161759 [Tetrahymena thermophila SB210]